MAFSRDDIAVLSEELKSVLDRHGSALSDILRDTLDAHSVNTSRELSTALREQGVILSQKLATALAKQDTALIAMLITALDERDSSEFQEPGPEASHVDRAKFEIKKILENNPPTNWNLPPELAGIAHRLARLPADQALDEAEAHIADIQAANENNERRSRDAQQDVDDLKDNPITSASRRGLIGYLTRQLLATLNGTPAIALRWFEVDEQGLHMYQPFATVTERIVTHADLSEGRLVVSVDPPGYLDAILGFLRQFRSSVAAPWGEVVVYETGSGDVIATAVAWKPDDKVRRIRKALGNIHLARNPYSNYQRVPRKVDLLSYYNFED